MFKTQAKVVSRKSLVRKVSKFLTSNFFTIDEFSKLTYRESKKVVKYLARIQRIKLNKEEIIDIIYFLRNIEKPKASFGVFKLFGDIKRHFVEVIEQVVECIHHVALNLFNQYLKMLQVFRC